MFTAYWVEGPRFGGPVAFWHPGHVIVTPRFITHSPETAVRSIEQEFGPPTD